MQGASPASPAHCTREEKLRLPPHLPRVSVGAGPCRASWRLVKDQVGRGGEEDVLRLQIAMDEALLVREGEALDGLEDEGAGQLQGQPAGAAGVGEEICGQGHTRILGRDARACGELFGGNFPRPCRGAWIFVGRLRGCYPRLISGEASSLLPPALFLSVTAVVRSRARRREFIREPQPEKWDGISRLEAKWGRVRIVRRWRRLASFLGQQTPPHLSVRASVVFHGRAETGWLASISFTARSGVVIQCGR